MSKIIAIGGGEIYEKETMSIDKEIINFSNKTNPNLLFIPTASNDSEKYSHTISEYFSELGCTVQTLLLKNKNISFHEIQQMILNTDIIYVGGGNTLEMMKTWKKYKINILLEKALLKNIVLCGLSAGSICWFQSGQSDSRKYKKNPHQFTNVSGLGFINALHSPHYNSEETRQEDLKRMTKKSSLVSIALENNCALQIKDNSYRIISSKKNAKAYKIYWKKQKFFKSEIIHSSKFLPLETLLKKN